MPLRRALTERSALLLLLVTAACAPNTPPPLPPAPPAVEPPPPPVVVTGAELDTLGEILRLEDRREFARGRFEAWSRSSSSLVRKHAALGAGRIGDRAAGA